MNLPANSLEEEFIQQIQSIDAQIEELMHEKRALERLLLKSRYTDVSQSGSVRTTSLNRVLAENRILDALAKAGTSLSNKRLYNEAAYVLPGLNSSTFRSYMKRLKDRGLIAKLGSSWILKQADTEDSD